MKDLPVVPYVGTWIEIYLCQNSDDEAGVVPYVGTWIEIGIQSYNSNC